jgi:hypothetical protein
MDTKKDLSQSEPSSPKKFLSFSIESILRKDSRKSDVFNRSSLESRCTSCVPSTPTLNEDINKKPSNGSVVADLPWLSYTRYSPPKLPSEYALLI